MKNVLDAMYFHYSTSLASPSRTPVRCNGLYWRLLFFTSKHSSFRPFFLPPIKNVSQSDMWMDKFTTILKYEGLKPYLWKNISTTHSTWNLWCLIDWIKHDADLAPNLIDISKHGCRTIVPERSVSPFLTPSLVAVSWAGRHCCCWWRWQQWGGTPQELDVLDLFPMVTVASALGVVHQHHRCASCYLYRK